MRHAVAITLIWTAACGQGDSTDRSVTRDSAGVQIVESFSPEWPAESRIEAEPLVEIGREQDGPYQFGYLTQARFLDDGSIAAVDFSAMEIRLFSADGEHVQTFGRRGQGPGEYQLISAILECEPQTLAAFDQRLRRLTIQPLHGSPPTSYDVPVAGNQDAFGCGANGPYLLYNPGQYRPELPEGLQWDSTSIVTWWPGDSAHSVARLPVFERLIGPNGDRRNLQPSGFAIHAVADSSFYWATSDRYEIRRLNFMGEVRQLLRRPIEPMPVSDSAYDAYVTWFLEQVEQMEGPTAVPRYRKSFEDGGRGSTMPLFGHAFVDHDGRLWVSASNWPSQVPIPGSWSVFGPDGKLLADLNTPGRVRIVDAHGDRVLGIAYDELDVMSLQVHRLLRE